MLFEGTCSTGMYNSVLSSIIAMSLSDETFVHRPSSLKFSNAQYNEPNLHKGDISFVNRSAMPRPFDRYAPRNIVYYGRTALSGYIHDMLRLQDTHR